MPPFLPASRQDEAPSSRRSSPSAAAPRERRSTAPPPGALSLRLALSGVHGGIAGTCLQGKLTVAAPNDAFEAEADRVSGEVTGAGEAALGGPGKDHAPLPIRGLSAAAAGPGELAPEMEGRIAGALSGGEPLAPGVRRDLEPRFGRSFDGVRVHTGEEAARTALSLGARAFTVGSDIAFGRGEYDPASTRGRSLLAHELTHVVQQGGARETRDAPPRPGRGAGGRATGGRIVQRDLVDALWAAAERELYLDPLDLPRRILMGADPLRSAFNQMLYASVATATRIGVPFEWWSKVWEFAEDDSEGWLLLIGLLRWPAFYRGGAILATQPAAAAMTLDDYVFVRDTLSLTTYVHEMVHVAQYSILGITRFLASYFGASAWTVISGWITGEEVNPMKSSPHETQAYDVAARFRDWHIAKYGSDSDGIVA